MTIPIWGKTPCVFKREKDEDGIYACLPELNDDMHWVFADGVMATDKLDGTNVAIRLENGKIVEIQNRTWTVTKDPLNLACMTKYEAKVWKGVLTALDEGWINLKGNDGESSKIIYGELVGPDINGNRHGVCDYYFVPFETCRTKFFWKSWEQNKYPKTFDCLKEWMRDYRSLFTEKCGMVGNYGEGLVFWHPDGRRAKLKRCNFNFKSNECQK